MARKAVKKQAEESTSAPESSNATGNGASGDLGPHTEQSSSGAKTVAERAPSVYKGLPAGLRKGNRAPTVSDIMIDPITQLAGEHWADPSKVHKFVLRQ
jgi:hypothetical protein